MGEEWSWEDVQFLIKKPTTTIKFYWKGFWLSILELMLEAWKEFSSDTLIWRSSFRWSQCLVCSGGSADRSLSVAVAVREFVPAAFCDQLLQCDLLAAVLPLPLLAWYHLVSPLCLTYTTCSAAVKFGEKPYCFLRLGWNWNMNLGTTFLPLLSPPIRFCRFIGRNKLLQFKLAYSFAKP